ncbi:MAG: branched-chain amino acid transaminase [Planctomycetota bacterium]
MKPPEWIWQNGELVPWAEATTHVMSHALHYGSSVFEGVRAYATAAGPCFFRLGCHLRRLEASAKVYGMTLPHDRDALAAACAGVVARNDLTAAYVRPLAYRGFGALGLDPAASPVDVIVAAFAWGSFLGADGLEKGIDACISSWQRLAPNTLPAAAKAGGNYLGGQLIATEAKRNGYDEGIALAIDGTVSEGSGENLFLVRDGKLITPPASAGILLGITRDTVMHIAAGLELEVIERAIVREQLYVADEVFLTGTAAEIAPVRSIDRIPVGNGGRGPITAEIQRQFFGLFDGTVEDRHGWLQAVEGTT